MTEVSSDWIRKDHSHLAKKFTFLPKGNGLTIQDCGQRILMAGWYLNSYTQHHMKAHCVCVCGGGLHSVAQSRVPLCDPMD